SIVKRFRNLSIFSIFCGLIQPVFLIFALFFFAITYIFQYGSVLQQKADNTISDQEKIIFALAEMSENKSGQTGQHIKRVSEYSKILAEGLNLPKFRIEEIRLASVWHDIGKLMIDSSILEKPGKLTDEEFATIKRHVVFGDELLRGLDGEVFEVARVIARDHHERIDGRGYAGGKSSGDISVEGRIVAVADVFDALTSRRSYKDAWNIDDAYNEIVKNSGTQFDAQVVEVFKNRFAEIKEVAEKFRSC
ncbi:MAG: HD-GYP domain-containing protein, partial [Treponemataceae bacterium]|nr:HD-GYP domain-containing protein [Treponemataceae bacterium]